MVLGRNLRAGGVKVVIDHLKGVMAKNFPKREYIAPFNGEESIHKDPICFGNLPLLKGKGECE